MGLLASVVSIPEGVKWQGGGLAILIYRKLTQNDGLTNTVEANNL